MKYVSRGDWFDKDTEVELLVDFRPSCDCGLFSGIRNGEEDEETCPFDEFYLSE